MSEIIEKLQINGNIIKKESVSGGSVNPKSGIVNGDVSKPERIYSEAILTSDLDVLLTVGGVTSGDKYLKGTTLETVIRDTFSPIMYPSFTNPSVSISTPGSKLVEKGSVVNTTATVSFNRGTINPAYGTSGYRSGAAISYSLNSGEEQEENSFFVEITEQHKSLSATVKYAEGEQPKDSVGNDYDEPYPAGQITTGTPLTYEFVDALWANTGQIEIVAKQPLVSKSVKQKEFSFPSQTVLHPEIFDVASTWTVTAIDVFNTLSQQWESVMGEFTVTTITHNDAGGNETEYKRYTDNRGYAAGARKIRIKWN